MDSATEQFYRRYINSINERRADLRDFVHESVVYNGGELTRAEYEALIAESILAAPDLFFDVTLLVTGGDHIGARIEFRCTPVAPFLDFPPTGKSVAFAEHVFYQLEAGKIRRVWSLIDRPAVQSQLNAD